jgi:hypothetical protein
MNELKNDMEYIPYNKSLNPDITAWKKYEGAMRLNSHGLNEINLPLNDTVLFGSADSAAKMDRTIPRLQVRLNSDKTFKDSIQACVTDEFKHRVEK